MGVFPISGQTQIDIMYNYIYILSINLHHLILGGSSHLVLAQVSLANPLVSHLYPLII